MHNSEKELFKSVIVKNALGIHARPAALIAKIANRAKDKVWIIKDGEKVDASSVIDILTLACAQGTDITLYIDSTDDMDLMAEIIALVADGFGE